MVTHEHNRTNDHICWGGCRQHPNHHMLEVRQLSIRYKNVEALHSISFRAHCGSTLALMGPNGAGKSSLLNALAGLLRPSEGAILWNETPLSRQKREIAYMPQRSEVDWKFPITVRQLVEMGRYPMLGPWKTPGKHDRDIVDRALEILDLNSLQHRQIGELSGGQQQRAFLARAVAQEAHILLLDEPFTGLDTAGISALSSLLRSLAAEGRLIVAAHHNLQDAADIFDQTVLLKTSLIANGATASVLTPNNLRLAFGTASAS